MKKLVCLLISGMLLLGVTGCSHEGTTDINFGKFEKKITNSQGEEVSVTDLENAMEYTEEQLDDIIGKGAYELIMYEEYNSFAVIVYADVDHFSTLSIDQWNYYTQQLCELEHAIDSALEAKGYVSMESEIVLADMEKDIPLFLVNDEVLLDVYNNIDRLNSVTGEVM